MPSKHTLTTWYFSQRGNFLKKSTHRELGVHEVKIRTTHSGLCYTDVHAKSKGCGLGHEGVGILTDAGEAVEELKVGDRVGWGWLHSSCSACPSCLSGHRQYCHEARGFSFSDLDQGAFGDYRIIDARFAYKIPEAVSSLDAGPFMCAGASVYEALDAAGTKPSDRVGVVGIGGLGHMAILFARAMGCGVTALTSNIGENNEKARDAFKLGADEVRALHGYHGPITASTDSSKNWVSYGIDPEKGPLRLINVLIVCSNELPDWSKMLPLLDRKASILLMSIQEQPLVMPYMPFILPGHRIIASTEASRRNHIDMLTFVAKNKIKPWIETFPMTDAGLKEAFEKLESGKMRYRGVLEVRDA